MIKFQPRVGTVVRCDFKGMIEPEMVKMRDVVVVARHPRNQRLVTIVPLSASQPLRPEPYHYELPSDPRPEGDSMRPIWAKCDMIYTLSIDRLEMHYTRTRRGGRQLAKVFLSAIDMDAIKKCIASAINLPYHEDVPEKGIESESATALTQPE